MKSEVPKVMARASFSLRPLWNYRQRWKSVVSKLNDRCTYFALRFHFCNDFSVNKPLDIGFAGWSKQDEGAVLHLDPQGSKTFTGRNLCLQCELPRQLGSAVLKLSTNPVLFVCLFCVLFCFPLFNLCTKLTMHTFKEGGNCDRSKKISVKLAALRANQKQTATKINFDLVLVAILYLKLKNLNFLV